MTQEELMTLLESTGLPVAYYAFPENEAPPLPFICYLYPNSDNFSADGIVYQTFNHVLIELYTKVKQPKYEAKVEAVLSSFFWNKTENYIESEQCFQIVYEMEV